MYTIILSMLIVGTCLYRSWLLAGAALILVMSLAIFKCRSKEKYVEFSDAKVEELRAKLNSIFPESKGIKVSGSDKSFTIDKKHIYLCIKDGDGNYYDDNSLMHVLLHEFSHVLCDEVDDKGEHKPKFKRIFGEVMEKAARAGIYDPNIPMIDKYCGY